jgi:dienelactone hydrolase
MPGRTAGCRFVEVADLVQGVALPLRLLYPSQASESVLRFGAYELSAAANAPVDGDRLPLIIVSHGGGGTGLTHRDMARWLARAGFVVALPDHMGDCRYDTTQSGKAANLINRPRHIRLLIDAALADPVLGAHIDASDITIVGHSMGGFTALAVAGGKPWADAHETGDGTPRRLPVAGDARVRRLILMAPACGWYAEAGSLSDIRVPMLLLLAGRDEHGPHLHPEYIQRDCDAALIEQHDIPEAGHHAFQSPFPQALSRPDLPASQDPPGFDRAAFQPLLCDRVLTWIERERQQSN